MNVFRILLCFVAVCFACGLTSCVILSYTAEPTTETPTLTFAELPVESGIIQYEDTKKSEQVEDIAIRVKKSSQVPLYNPLISYYEGRFLYQAYKAKSNIQNQNTTCKLKIIKYSDERGIQYVIKPFKSKSAKYTFYASVSDLYQKNPLKFCSVKANGTVFDVYVRNKKRAFDTKLLTDWQESDGQEFFVFKDGSLCASFSKSEWTLYDTRQSPLLKNITANILAVFFCIEKYEM